MTNSSDLTERVRQVDGFIRVLIEEAHFMNERRHLLLPLIRDDAVKAALQAKLNNSPGLGLWNQLAPLLGQDLIRELARLFLDRGEKTGSLTNLWRKIQADDGVRRYFRDRCPATSTDLYDGAIRGLSEEVAAMLREQWRWDDHEEDLAVFDLAWRRVEQHMASLADDPVSEKIRAFRDRSHSHFEVQRWGEEPKPVDVTKLTFDEIFAFCDRCLMILSELGLLLTGMEWNPDEYAEVSAEQANALWMTLAS